MAVGIPNFPFENLQMMQAPTVTANQAGSDITQKLIAPLIQYRQQQMEKQMQQAKMQQLMAAIANAQAQQQGQEIKNRFMPDQLAAQLGLAQGKEQEQTVSNLFQPQKLQSDIGAKLAQAFKAGEEGKYVAPKAEQLMALQRGQLANLGRPQSTPGQIVSDRDRIIQKYGLGSEELKLFDRLYGQDIAAKEALTENRQMQAGAREFKSLPHLTQTQAVANWQRLGVPATGIAQITSHYPEYYDEKGATQKLADYIANIPADQRLQAMQEVNQTEGSISKQTMTVNQQTQLARALNFKSIMDQYEPYVQAYVKYAGPQGLIKKAAGNAAAIAQLKQNSDYEDYIQFKRALPDMASEFRAKIGSQATDHERAIMDSIVDPNYWAANQKIALDRWNNFKQENKNIDRNLTLSSLQKSRELTGGEKPSISQRVLAKPGEQQKTAQLPTFNSKQEFQQWLLQATPEQKAEAKRKYGL